MRLRTWFFLSLGLISILFLYFERAILTPFILAAIFAYIFNPTINFLSKKLFLPRTLGILIIYLFLLLFVVSLGVFLSQRVSIESFDLNKLTTTTITNAAHQLQGVPAWLQPSIKELLTNLRQSRFLRIINPTATIPFSTTAISRIISFFIFLFSAFYFLKDGEVAAQKILAFVPAKYKVDVDVLVRKINAVLRGYLRGQILLVFLMSILLYIGLQILGMRFALIVAIFSGFAEIVPVIGPITAGAVAVIVMLLTGTNNFGLQPLNASLIIIVIYFLFRQLEDYLIIPHVMEKITKLPPFLIFFVVIAGGHIGGVLGLILAVPIAAIIRLLLEFSLDKMS